MAGIKAYLSPTAPNVFRFPEWKEDTYYPVGAMVSTSTDNDDPLALYVAVKDVPASLGLTPDSDLIDQYWKLLYQTDDNTITANTSVPRWSNQLSYLSGDIINYNGILYEFEPRTVNGITTPNTGTNPLANQSAAIVEWSPIGGADATTINNAIANYIAANPATNLDSDVIKAIYDGHIIAGNAPIDSDKIIAAVNNHYTTAALPFSTPTVAAINALIDGKNDTGVYQWTEGTYFAAETLVAYKGDIYEVLISHAATSIPATKLPPDNPTEYRKITGIKFDFGTQYEVGDVVSHEGVLYSVIQQFVPGMVNTSLPPSTNTIKFAPVIADINPADVDAIIDAYLLNPANDSEIGTAVNRVLDDPAAAAIVNTHITNYLADAGNDSEIKPALDRYMVSPSTQQIIDGTIANYLNNNDVGLDSDEVKTLIAANSVDSDAVNVLIAAAEADDAVRKWAATTTFADKDLVSYDGDIYSAVGPSTNVTPGTNAQWQIIGGNSAGLEFVVGNDYVLGQFVSYNNELYYASAAITNALQTPNTDNRWTKFTGSNTTAPTDLKWNAGKTYGANDFATFNDNMYRAIVAPTNNDSPALNTAEWAIYPASAAAINDLISIKEFVVGTTIEDGDLIHVGEGRVFEFNGNNTLNGAQSPLTLLNTHHPLSGVHGSNTFWGMWTQRFISIDSDAVSTMITEAGGLPRWSAGKTYADGDLVYHNSEIYEALVNNTSASTNAPGVSTTTWSLKYNSAATPSSSYIRKHVNTNSYVAGEIFVHEGDFWQAVSAHTGANTGYNSNPHNFPGTLERINPNNVFNANNAYSAGELVVSGQSLYIANIDISGATAASLTNATQFTKIYGPTDAAAIKKFVSGTTYSAGDLVMHNDEVWKFGSGTYTNTQRFSTPTGTGFNEPWSLLYGIDAFSDAATYYSGNVVSHNGELWMCSVTRSDPNIFNTNNFRQITGGTSTGTGSANIELFTSPRSTGYPAGSYVRYENSIYYATAAMNPWIPGNTIVAPGAASNNNWVEIKDMPWSANKRYAIDDMVTHSGVIWISQQAQNSGAGGWREPGTNESFWRPYTQAVTDAILQAVPVFAAMDSDVEALKDMNALDPILRYNSGAVYAEGDFAYHNKVLYYVDDATAQPTGNTAVAPADDLSGFWVRFGEPPVDPTKTSLYNQQTTITARKTTTESIVAPRAFADFSYTVYHNGIRLISTTDYVASANNATSTLIRVNGPFEIGDIITYDAVYMG